MDADTYTQTALLIAQQAAGDPEAMRAALETLEQEAEAGELDAVDGVPNLEEGAPGPPPRPGLVFDTSSHRWVRPEHAAGGGGSTGTQGGEPQELSDRELGGIAGGVSRPPTGLDPREVSDRRSTASYLGAVAKAGVAAFRWVGHKVHDLEHAGAKFVEDGIPSRIEKIREHEDRLGTAPVLSSVVAGAWHVSKLATKALFATYTLGQNMAEEVAKARGATPEQAAKLKGIVTGLDLGGAKGVPLGLELLAHASVATAGMAGFVPWGSVAYLAYSAARNPVAFARGATRAVAKGIASLPQGVRDTFRLRQPPPLLEALEGGDTSGEVEAILTALQEAEQQGKAEAWHACFMTALDQVGSVEQALQVAEAALPHMEEAA